MDHSAPTTSPARRPETPSPSNDFHIVKGQTTLNEFVLPVYQLREVEAAAADLEILYAVSVSMPPSPSKVQIQQGKKVVIKDHNEQLSYNNTPKSHDSPISSNTSPQIPETCYSHPIIPRSMTDLPMRNPSLDKLKNGRFNSFKTRSGKFERQMSSLRGGLKRGTLEDSNAVQNKEVENLPVARYYDALQGPELDSLKPSEELLLPKDEKWPFLLRFQISSFGICLGLSSQAIMWKALATSTSTKFLQISLNINLALWCISLAFVAIVSLIYILKMVLYFEAVRREYYHPVRVNFFFAPWITFLFLVLGAPPKFSQHLHAVLWYVLMAPIFCLEVKFYGQWMSGGQRRLSKVANPSNHLSVVGNFVGSLVGASMGLKEGPLFFFAVGLAHYVVLFVTLYQRLPTNETLPKDLHPVFFLFIAAPSVASMAWADIQGSFDYGSKIAYFIAMFLYFSLAVRINFFRGFRFSLAWWVYTFPMTGAAIATINYSNVVTNTFTKSLAVALCAIAFFTVIALLLTTIVHAFMLKDLFPNDVAIAISERRQSSAGRRHIPVGGGGSLNNKEIEHYLKFADVFEENDLEAPSEPPTSATSVSGQNDDSSNQRR